MKDNGKIKAVTVCHYNLFKLLTTLNPLPDDKILDWSKIEQIADDILKCI